MRECLLIPDETDNYPVQRDRINRYNERTPFAKLRTQLAEEPEKLKGKKSMPAFQKIGQMLGVFNFLPLLILQRILAPIKDIVFYGSLKYAFGLFVFPLWYLIVFGVAAPFLGLVHAAYLVLGLFGLLFVRQYLIRWSNPPH